MKIEDLTLDEIAALTIWGEARGEPVEGQIAVGFVIIHRALSKKYGNIRDACLAPKQFSCWNEDDPNRELMLKIGDQFNLQYVTDRVLRQAHWIARGLIQDSFVDNTSNALNYMTKDLFHSERRPSWAKNVTRVKEIGNHVFFTA